MKTFTRCLALVLFTFMFVGCSDMMRSLRQESLAIDEEAERDRSDDENQERQIQTRPLRGITANNVNKYDPPVRRDYQRKLASAANSLDSVKEEAEKRFTRADFVDTSSQENSLW